MACGIAGKITGKFSVSGIYRVPVMAGRLGGEF